MMTDMAVMILTLSCLVISCLSDEFFQEIYSLIQKQEYGGAKLLAEKVLEDAPDNVSVKYLLALVHNTAEGGDLARAVRLALEQPSFQALLEVATWPEGEVRRDLREWAASTALDAAMKTNDDDIMKFSAEVIMEHQRKHNQFREKIIRDAVTLKAEMLVAAAEFEEAKTLLSSGLVAETNMELDLLRLFFMKLDERRQNIEETSESKSLLDSLKLLTHDEARKEELEVPKQRIRMMDGRWMNLRAELQVEGEVLMGIMEELRIYPVNGNMPSWTVRDLTSRPVWDLASLGPELEASLRMVEAQWEQLKQEAVAVVADHSWVQQAGVWIRGETIIESKDRWQQLILSRGDIPAPPAAVCKVAPLLCSLPDTLYGPDGSGRPAAGDIKLSVLSGATHLAPHYGLINTKLRAHLPLLIPTDPAPVLIVDGQNITWTEGTMFLFDDTYEHEVIHESDAQRIVLLIDLHHPDLSEERRRLWQKRFQVTRWSVSGPTYVVNYDEEVTKGEGGKDEL